MNNKKMPADNPAGREKPSFRDRLRESTLFGGPGKKWTLLAAPILIGLLVVVSLVVLFWPSAEQTPAASTPPTPTGTATAAPAAPDAETCAASVVDVDAVAPPADLAWTSAYGNSWPVSATVGPKVSVDGLGHCFDHTPIGAALAAVNLFQSLRTADVETAHRILDTQFVQDSGTAAASAGVDEYFAAQPPETRQLGRVMGYNINFFNEDMAQIFLVEDWAGRGQYTGYAVTVLWQDGDWKAQMQPSGEPSEYGDITVDPDGFTRWAVAP